MFSCLIPLDSVVKILVTISLKLWPASWTSFASWETLPDQVWVSSICWRKEVVSSKHSDILEGPRIGILNTLYCDTINLDSVENLNISKGIFKHCNLLKFTDLFILFLLGNFNVIQFVELNFIVEFLLKANRAIITS